MGDNLVDSLLAGGPIPTEPAPPSPSSPPPPPADDLGDDDLYPARRAPAPSFTNYPPPKQARPARPAFVSPELEALADQTTATNGLEPETYAALEALRSDGPAPTLTIERIGPKVSFGKPVQLGYCGTLPGDIKNLPEVIKEKWGGGEYKLACPAFRKPIRPLKLAGIPKALDEEEAEQAEEMGMTQDGKPFEPAEPRMPSPFGSGPGLGGFGRPVNPLAGLHGGGPASDPFNPHAPREMVRDQGWVWIESENNYRWTGPGLVPPFPAPIPPHMRPNKLRPGRNPYLHRVAEDDDEIATEIRNLKAENAEAKRQAEEVARRAEMDRLRQEILAQTSPKGPDPMTAMVELQKIQIAMAKEARELQLAEDRRREEREEKRRAEEARLRAEEAARREEERKEAARIRKEEKEAEERRREAEERRREEAKREERERREEAERRQREAEEKAEARRLAHEKELENRAYEERKRQEEAERRREEREAQWRREDALREAQRREEDLKRQAEERRFALEREEQRLKEQREAEERRAREHREAQEKLMEAVMAAKGSGGLQERLQELQALKELTSDGAREVDPEEAGSTAFAKTLESVSKTTLPGLAQVVSAYRGTGEFAPVNPPALPAPVTVTQVPQVPNPAPPRALPGPAPLPNPHGEVPLPIRVGPDGRPLASPTVPLNPSGPAVAPAPVSAPVVPSDPHAAIPLPMAPTPPQESEAALTVVLDKVLQAHAAGLKPKKAAEGLTDFCGRNGIDAKALAEQFREESAESILAKLSLFQTVATDKAQAERIGQAVAALSTGAGQDWLDEFLDLMVGAA